MNKIYIEYENHIVEFENVPFALARSFESILHHVEFDSNVVSAEIEKEQENGS